MDIEKAFIAGEVPDLLSKNFRATDIICAGETWATTNVPNAPAQSGTWNSLTRLCEDVLEPVHAQFGPPVITYGFASPALTRSIHERIAPELDQHAGHEIKRNGRPVCCRLGQAVDFHVPGHSSAVVALWIVENRPFDRMYFYGEDRPLHVSVGPDESRAITAMLPAKSGRRVPRQADANWLKGRIDGTAAARSG